jgi:hypothetical protein
MLELILDDASGVEAWQQQRAAQVGTWLGWGCGVWGGVGWGVARTERASESTHVGCKQRVHPDCMRVPARSRAFVGMQCPVVVRGIRLIV